MDVPSLLVVFGGAIAACLISFPLRTIRGSPQVVKKILFNRPEDYPALIAQIAHLAETARRDGLLALEHRLDEVAHPFIRLGVQLAVDGTRPEIIEDLMRTEIDALASRHREGKNLMDQMGRLTPAFGLIGTLIGLVMMLSNMSDPSSIGAGMAVALLTTLYGCLASHAIFLPFAEKLAYLNQQELYALEIITRGILAIQTGENPRVIEQKLSTFLTPQQRLPKRKAA
jgi:chemotaxis protein MotA